MWSFRAIVKQIQCEFVFTVALCLQSPFYLSDLAHPSSRYPLDFVENVAKLKFYTDFSVLMYCQQLQSVQI